MKKVLYIILLCFIPILLLGQGKKFTPTTTLPVNLNTGIDYINCSSPGTKGRINFNVTGVGILSNTNALASINISFNTSCGFNMKSLGLYIKSPSGTCLRIYNGAEVAANLNGIVNVVLRDGDCLLEPNIEDTWTTVKTTSGNFGVFRANSTTTMESTFNGQNADGIWTIYAFEGGSAPCISSIELLFADPKVENRLTNGDDCGNPIVWNGQPLCTQTGGKTGSSQMPGSTEGPNKSTFGTISGVACEWNNKNDNDVWIKFKSTGGGTICISISGLRFNQHSIVVKDANVDNNNDPCSQVPKKTTSPENDPNWIVASCPRWGSNAIYGSTAGTTKNQQHCFLAQENEVFYLVVDGTDGIETPFYITGISGPLNAILPLNNNPYINVPRNNVDLDVSMNGTKLKTNMGSNKYIQDIIIYDDLGRTIYKTKKFIKGYSEYDLRDFMKNGFNIIKVFVDDKKYSNFTFKIIKN